MSESVALNKSLQFSVRIVSLWRYLTKTKNEFIMSKQLIRCGTSIGANLSEAQYAQSTNDFISKVSIALKETAETEYWLKLLYQTEYLSETEFDSIHADCEELIRLLTSITKTSKQALI